MEQRYRASLYAQLGEMDIQETKRLLLNLIRRHGGTGDGATLVMVAERAEEPGTIAGFIVGLLERVYGVGVPLTATDLWFCCRPGADLAEVRGLLGAVLLWARGNPRVVEIKFGVVDTFGTDLEAADALYRRLGLERCGAIYRGSISR
ncbi:MAG: hypothetical protein LDL44_03645 [Caenispirillum sp.]|nr:hypothetical protein [Caenispirillum sp.]